jgi:hypothetical protein
MSRFVGMLALGFLISAPRVRAVSVVIPAAADNTLYESPTGARSNGIGTHFFAGRTAESDSALRRGLVRFDVAAHLPADAMILDAMLMLHLSTTSSGEMPVRVHRVSASWGEGTSDAPGSEGAGTAATPGDATWIHRAQPASFWAAAGGDFVPAASALTLVTGVGDYVWSSAQLRADVQSHFAQPVNNFGWILIGEESFPVTSKRFDSREHPDAGLRPKLIVAFTTATDVESRAAPLAILAYPNPFRDEIMLRGGAAGFEILDVRGRLVRSLASDAIAWDGRDRHGSAAPAGIYFVHAPGVASLHRIVRIR